MTPRKRAPVVRKGAPRAKKAVAPGRTRVAKRAPRKRGGSAASPADIEAQLTAIERGSGEGDLELGRGITLHVSSLGKVYFKEAGVSKGALMRYYTRISPVLLPHIADRPLVLKRYPDGAGGSMFFQQEAGPHVPAVVQTKALPTEDKGDRQRIIGGALATLLYTVQLGAIEVHPWLSRITDIDSADRCLIDLDPDDDVPFSAVVQLARDVLGVIEESGLSAAVKTSGSSGIHLVIALPPRTSYETSARLARQIAQVMVVEQPERATVERSIGARPKGTIYVDAMQNARGKSAASAYSVRAKPDASVSAPVTPRELTARLRMDAFTVKTMPARVAKLGDMFGEALTQRSTTTRALTRALEVLDTLTATRLRRGQKRSRTGGRGA